MQTSLFFKDYSPSHPQVRTTSVAEIQLRYRPKTNASLLPKISDSKDSFRLLISSWDSDLLEFVEQFKVLLLNRAQRVIGSVLISTGSTTATVVDPKLVLAAAIKSNASSLILSHCHPSQNIQPSQSDIALTKRIKQAAELMDIQVLDHIIVARNQYFSFADEGLM